VKKALAWGLLLVFATIFSATSVYAREYPPAGPPPGYQEEDSLDQQHQYPFRWHQKRARFLRSSRMERINQPEWHDKFPGMHIYRWHGEPGGNGGPEGPGDDGFMYRDHWITDAVFFYDDEDELVSVGFMCDGVFVRISADHDEEISRDAFFAWWWRYS